KELLGPIYALNLPYIEGALTGIPQSFEREIPDPNGGPARYSKANYMPDIVDGVVRGFYVLVADITQQKANENELRAAKLAAEEALAEVGTLRGLLPICAWCNRIRNDEGIYEPFQRYVAKHAEVVITHGICQDCMVKEFAEDPT
ncbi:MAG: hypothetical protein ABI852_18300, partial [Gemmatimonadaceae bacterium]